MPSNRILRVVGGLIVLAILIAAGAAMMKHVDMEAMLAAFAEASWKWAAAAALVNLLSIVVDAVRWKSIVAGVRRVSIVTAIESLLIGWLSNLIVPLKLGEGAKVWVMSRREALPIATVVSTVVLDRAVDIVTLLLFIGVTSIVAPLPPAIEKVRGVGVMALIVLGVGIGMGVRSMTRRREGGTISTGRFARLLDGFSILGHQHRLGPIVAVALCAWILRAGVVWCTMQAFHLSLPVAAAASVLVAVNVGISAIAAPGNLGVFELSAVAGLALWNVPGEIALGFAIALHALELVPTTVLGLAVQAILGVPLRR